MHMRINEAGNYRKPAEIDRRPPHPGRARSEALDMAIAYFQPPVRLDLRICSVEQREIVEYLGCGNLSQLLIWLSCQAFSFLLLAKGKKNRMQNRSPCQEKSMKIQSDKWFRETFGREVPFDNRGCLLYKMVTLVIRVRRLWRVRGQLLCPRRT